MKKPLITSDPDIMLGKPVITGTRITIENLLDKLASGRTIDQLLQSYPNLSREKILAALSFAADAMHCQAAYPLNRKAA